MGKDLFDMLWNIKGKLCEFETHESAYRTEVVHHVTEREIKYADVVVKYPMKICFDAAETDFLHISSLKSVRVVGSDV